MAWASANKLRLFGVFGRWNNPLLHACLPAKNHAFESVRSPFSLAANPSFVSLLSLTTDLHPLPDSEDTFAWHPIFRRREASFDVTIGLPSCNEWRDRPTALNLLYRSTILLPLHYIFYPPRQRNSSLLSEQAKKLKLSIRLLEASPKNRGPFIAHVHTHCTLFPTPAVSFPRLVGARCFLGALPSPIAGLQYRHRRRGWCLNPFEGHRPKVPTSSQHASPAPLIATEPDRPSQAFKL